MNTSYDWIKNDPQGPLIAALECLMYESWDGMPDRPDKTDVRIHYIKGILRYFDVTPKEKCGYHPKHFMSYSKQSS